jgi:hypothetical protein
LAVVAAWNYGESRKESSDDESADSDDEFDLRMCKDNSDDNLRELRKSYQSQDEDE